MRSSFRSTSNIRGTALNRPNRLHQVVCYPSETNNLIIMAWKRGAQNNQAGIIRIGHVKEFVRSTIARESREFGYLKIVEIEEIPSLANYSESVSALICTEENGLPELLARNLQGNSIYLHAHGNYM